MKKLLLSILITLAWAVVVYAGAPYSEPALPVSASAGLSSPWQLGLAANAVVSVREFNGVRATSLALIYLAFLVGGMAFLGFLLKDLLRDFPQALKRFWNPESR